MVNSNFQEQHELQSLNNVTPLEIIEANTSTHEITGNQVQVILRETEMSEPPVKKEGEINQSEDP